MMYSSIKNSICLIILFLTCGFTQAQDTLDYPKLILKIAPLNFLDNLSFRSAQVGFEYRFTPRYSSDCSYGQVFGFDFFGDDKGTGFKLKTEVRRYLKKNSIKRYDNNRIKRFEKYFALEGFYHKIDYPTSNSFEDTVASVIYSEDYFIKKNVWGLNIKCGFEASSRKIVIDVFGGIGIRVKNVEHLDRDRPEDEFHTIDLRGVNVRDHEGYYATLNLSLGFKIGYIIK